MKIRRYVTWGPARWVMSIGSTALSLAGYGLFWASPGVTTAMRAAFALVPVAFAVLWTRWYFVRKEHADAIDYVTSDGISVIGDPLHEMEVELAMAVGFNEDFWSHYYNREEIRDYLNGGTVTFHDGLVVDKHHGVTSTELTDGKDVHVTRGPSAIGGLKHGLGHVCLNGSGVPNDNVVQHGIMRNTGFPYA